MKNIILLLIFICGIIFPTLAQENKWSISTTRFGNLTILMKKSEAQSLVNKELNTPSESNDYNGTTTVTYQGETIEITLGEYYENDNQQPTMVIHSVATQSPLFHILSGIKIGSTKEELINSYKNYNNFTMFPKWSPQGTIIKNESIFSIQDINNQTILSFTLKNNIVTKIELSIYYEGC